VGSWSQLVATATYYGIQRSQYRHRKSDPANLVLGCLPRRHARDSGFDPRPEVGLPEVVEAHAPGACVFLACVWRLCFWRVFGVCVYGMCVCVCVWVGVRDALHVI
jgi:hypothetical protein